MSDKEILSFDPWGDGKGDDPYRVLKNRMVVGRNLYECAICLGPIIAGERHRAQTEVNLDGSRVVRTFRFCAECCAVMPSWFKYDEAERVTARYSLGQRRAQARHAASFEVTQD